MIRTEEHKALHQYLVPHAVFIQAHRPCIKLQKMNQAASAANKTK